MSICVAKSNQRNEIFISLARSFVLFVPTQGRQINAAQQNLGKILVLRGRISRTSLAVLLAVLARSLALERTDFLLRPLEIAADLVGISHTLMETLPCLCKTSLCFLLQLQELTVLGVHLSGCLRLHGHAAIERNRVKRVSEPILHIFLEIDTAS